MDKLQDRPFDVNKVLSHVEKELTPRVEKEAIPDMKPGRAIGVPEAVAAYAPPAIRAQRDHRVESPLQDLAVQLLRLTYIEMMTYCRGVVGAEQANELADKVHAWAATDNKE